MTSPDVTTPPGTGFVAGIAAATGMHTADEYSLAQLLITYPTSRLAHETVESIEAGMRRLAAALHLGPGNATPPVIGGRLILRREVTALDYGHDDYVISIPAPSHEWLRLVRGGAPCPVCLVFAPLSLAVGQAEADANPRASLERGAVVRGTTYARRRF